MSKNTLSNNANYEAEILNISKQFVTLEIYSPYTAGAILKSS